MRNWEAEAQAVARRSSGAAEALDRLEAEAPRPWRATVIAAVLCTPRSEEVQAALEQTNRWMRWRAVLPHDLACTYLTLCHPPGRTLTCSGCEAPFLPRDGVIASLAQFCFRCLQLKTHRPRTRCLGCGAKAVAGMGFCRQCHLQIAALGKARSASPPPFPRGLHALLKARQ